MTAPLLAAALLLGAGGHPVGVRWERNFDAAVQKAKAQNKALMVDFWADWCGWCHHLDETTYVDPDVVRLSADFVPVKVNTEGSRSDARVAQRYGVSSLPTIAFLSPSGRPLLLVNGFQGPGTFPHLMDSARQAAAQVLEWEAALDKDPNNAEVLIKLGVHVFEQESYEDARDLLMKAVRVDGNRPVAERKQARMLLGIIHHYSRKYAEAEAVLKEALALRPAGPYEAQILYVLGRTYKAWGRVDQARPVLQQVVRSYPDSPFAQRAQETLVVLDRSR